MIGPERDEPGLKTTTKLAADLYRSRARRRLQPVERRPIHAEGTSKVHDGLAGIHAVQRFPPLVSRHLGRATEPHALSLSAHAAVACAGPPFVKASGFTPE